ncbi:unnamed protein product [Paramecium primaurelia]|uniref:Uncharacterized protein n=1 Tax=Paramecium primaurelia TaxID=5886 RepID=A0A8S1L0C2_PARPR|nr:unnamed protein product [Paramecium primaurelia]
MKLNNNLLTLKQITELECKITKDYLIYKEEEYSDQYSQIVVIKSNRIIIVTQIEQGCKINLSKKQNENSQLELSFKEHQILLNIIDLKTYNGLTIISQIFYSVQEFYDSNSLQQKQQYILLESNMYICL